MRRWVISFVGLMALVGCDKIKALQGGGADAAATSVTAEDAAAATAAATTTGAPTATALTDEAGAAPPTTASAAATPTGGAVAVATGAAPQPVQPQPVPTAQINNGAKQVGVETSSGGTALNLRNDAGTGRVVNNPGGGVTITGKSGKTLNVPTGGLPGVPR